MAATVASPAMKRLDLRDPAALFETHGAEEIRGLERQVRAEIEHKKEELRQMVGERYRDLIEAADTIGQMRRCADGLVDAVRATDQYCARLRQADPAASRPQPVREQQPSQEKFYSMAAQIKLLLDIPEKMWSAMEASQYLHATQLYLLCCYLHSLLQLNSAQTLHSPVLSRFPILIQQVAAASHFRSTILHESKKLLKCHTVPDQAVAEALCSIMLLEESSPRQALTDFLLARKTSIQKLLQQLHHDGGAKAQICLLVEVMATTLNQAHALFYTLPEGHLPDPSLPCGLLFSTLETITGQQPTGRGIPILQEGMKLCSWSRYLPPSIVEFQPALRTLAHPISQEFLKDTLQKWIHMCSEDIKNGLNNLLRFVKNIHDLAEVRDAMWRLLASESTSHSWNVVCQRLLEKPFLFWEDLMQQLFLHRLQTLMKEGFAAISSSCRELLISALHELEPSTSSSTPNKHIHLEHNMSLFLWTESPSDLPPDAAWVSVANRAEFAGSGLARKAHNISPCVQSFCSVLDSKLKGQLDDLLAYLPPDKASLPRDGSPKNCAFDRYSDAGTVQDVLQTHSVACIQTITSCISDELQRAEGLHRQQEGGTASRLHAVLFMARLCQSLGDLCPHLKQCILGKSGSTEKPARELRTLKKLGKGSAPEAVPLQSKWQEVRGLLLQQSVAAYRVWSSALVNALETESQMEMRPFSLEKGYLLFKALVQGFTQSLLLDDAASVLAMATSWEELEIQEETESGSSVTSKIRLPVQPSWCVQAFLFTLCQEINRVGGHALPKVTLQETLKNCMVQIVSAYERLSEEKETKREGAIPVTQNQALQLLYDVRYLSIVLTSRSEEKGGRNKQDPRTEKVINYLEALIDPFDLDVFTPHLNSNLTRLVQRTSVLFGLVAGTDSPFTPRSSTFNSQEPHNILPLAASQIRFGLLPLSMTSTRKTKATSRSTETHVQVVPPALSQADDPMHPGSLFRQLVSEEGDTSTPSLFRLSWLSSMTK